MNPAELRLVECGECEMLKKQIDALQQEVDLLRDECSAQRREASRLRSAQAGARKRDPNHDVAYELFEYWKQRCNHPQAKLGPKREKALLARLANYPPRSIAEAIKGAEVGAFVDEKGNRFDDIELICRDEVKLESFIARYRRWKEHQA